MTYLIVDAHEDLAFNMLTYGRDYTRSIQETRQREKDTYIVENNGDTTLSWQAMQQGRVAVIFSTLFAAPSRLKPREWDTQVYANPNEANRVYNGQLDAYERLFDEHSDKFTPIRSKPQLEALLEKWNQANATPPTGLVALMEGAEGVREIDELEEWWQRGVRIIGPAWMATRFCGGTREPGPLTALGRELLQAMAPIGFTLDLSHMAWESAREALDLYDGPIIASHANALKQVKHGTINRFLTDDIIEGIIQRNGVIGIVPYNRFLDESWKDGDPRSNCPLDMVAAQMDYICQIAGNANHAAFGTDFDGGFGLQQIPDGLDNIADLQKVAPLLEARGFTQPQIAAIFGGNWIEMLKRTLPA
jgi:membrane dipeptidase